MQSKIVSVLGCSKLDLGKSSEEILNSFSGQALIDECNSFELKEGYKRAVLYKDKNIEIIFCHWPSGAKSPVHGHPNVDCSLRCLEGEMADIRSMGREKLTLKKDEKSQIDDSQGAHQMINMTLDCAYTLHVYRQIES